ncbi:hypothetical protein J2772_001617 [Chryseobacterium jejuense]|nr:hypothetical protein [Chryseobacterium jejuense]
MNGTGIFQVSSIMYKNIFRMFMILILKKIKEKEFLSAGAKLKKQQFCNHRKMETGKNHSASMEYRSIYFQLL